MVTYYTAKVSDFGLSRLVSPDRSSRIVYRCARNGWVFRPRILTNQPTDREERCVGVVMVELLTGKRAVHLAKYFISSLKEDRPVVQNS